MHMFGVWIVVIALAMGSWLVPAPAEAQGKVKILASQARRPAAQGDGGRVHQEDRHPGRILRAGPPRLLRERDHQLVAGTDAFDLAQINSTFVTELAARGPSSSGTNI